jgi:hypothetical protein
MLFCWLRILAAPPVSFRALSSSWLMPGARLLLQQKKKRQPSFSGELFYF